jgi:ABC-type dipeptide/oligopeptide/nickel transport system permease subunit
MADVRPDPVMAPTGDDEPSRSARRRPFPAIGWVGVTLVGGFLSMALEAPRLAGYRVTQLAGEPLSPPSWSHLLGTNSVGQDVASQIVFGARTSLFMAVVAGGGTVLLGALVGMVAGWRGGWTDAVLMRVVDLFLVIPSLPLLIVLGAYAGPSMTAIALIVAATAWPPSARIIRAQVLSLRRRAHLQASVGFGARSVHVLRQHVVPEVGLITAAAFVGAAGRAVMTEAGLAFLGLGDPTRASWGKLMRDALNFSALFNTRAWSWWLVPPATCIALFLLALTFVGIGLEQWINPRLARHAGGRRSR